MPLDVEIPVLRGFLTGSEAAEWKQSVYCTPGSGSLLQALMDGDFEGVLRSPLVLDLLSEGSSCDGESIDVYLETRVLQYLTSGTEEDQVNREVSVMVLAVSCLHLFAQSNWTGPPLSIPVSDLLPSSLLSTQPKPLVETLHSSLILDGESVYGLVSNPLLLLLARIILTRCSAKLDSVQLLPWWTLRYIHLHQEILEAPSPQLLSLAQTSIHKVLQCQDVLLEQKTLSLQFNLECVYINLSYYEYQAAKKHMETTQQLLELDVNLTGALGKRTRFQQKSLAQLVLQVTRKQDQRVERVPEATPTPTPQTSLPKDLLLGDDTVLDRISLEEQDQYELPDLSAEEQAVILGICSHYQKNNPLHKLTEEELLAFTSCLLSQPKFWAVEVSALCLRTKLEKGSSRRVERAMMQTQALVDFFEEKNCPVSERLKVFYCCRAPPRWSVQKQLASLLTDLGCTSSALLMYEQLQLWEDVVVCYERLGQHGKAEEIVRRELEKKETPTLLCLLGDILKEHQYYERAWEVSGGRSSRAMRSKALLHLQHKEFQQCAECFEKSLNINHMQLGVWFSLGCTYLSLQNYEGAARSFQRCVILEPDNAEAWNNLSSAYIRLQKKDKAFLTLREALKCNYEHWQIWENFIVVSTDIGEFAEAIMAYHRLMDLRETYKDVQILQILVRAVVEDLLDHQGLEAGTHRSKLTELLGRVSARHCSDAEIWRQYALLYGDGLSSDPQDNEKALQFLLKSHRCLLQSSGCWEKDVCVFRDVLDRGVHLGKVTISCGQKKSNPAEALPMLSTTRLSLRSLVTKTKQLHSDVSTGQICNELQGGVAALEQVITDLQELSRSSQTCRS